MSPSAAPPTPQEVQRKLSVHSASHPVKPSSSTTIPTTAVSGTESDSDSIITPDVGISSSHAGVSGTYHAASLISPPLSSIAEQCPGSGAEDSDEEEEEGGWQMGESVAAKIPRGVDTTMKSGYLSKKGARRKTWKKRWFVLRPSHLAFYKNEAEYKLLRLLDLADVHSCTPVHLKRHDNAFGLILPKRTYYLQAGSAPDAQAWVAAIEEARLTLMATSTQTSTNSTAIPIPGAPTTSTTSKRSAPISVSPDYSSHQIVNSSDSEDALSQFAAPPSPPLPPPPASSSVAEAQRPNPQNVTFRPSPPVSKESPKVILSGYLMKCGSKRRTWRKRWFVLSSDKLIYSRSHMDTKPHRMFSFNEILDAMDYDMPTHRHHPNVLAPSVSSTPSHGNGGGYTTGGTSDLSDSQLKNFTFKIVMTKRNLLLCAPSEEDEIKWLGAVRALIARRTGSGALSGQQPQPQQPQPQPQQQASTATTMARAESSGGGGGVKSTVKRLSVGTSMQAGGGGKSTPSPDEEVRDTH